MWGSSRLLLPRHPLRGCAAGGPPRTHHSSRRSASLAPGEVVGPGEPADRITVSWRIVAIAVFADFIPGWEIVTGVSESNTGTARQVDALCPFGKRVVGGGASPAQRLGQISVKSLDLNDNYIRTAAIDDEDGYPGAWSITSYAMYVNPVPRIQHAVWGTNDDSISPKTSTATLLGRSPGVATSVAADCSQEQVLKHVRVHHCRRRRRHHGRIRGRHRLLWHLGRVHPNNLAFPVRRV